MTFPTLSLTSPITTGKNVLEAQRLLKMRGFYSPAFDGQFGPLTGAAVHRAKHALGYKDRKINNVFDDALYQYLSGKAKPTTGMKLRAAARARKTADASTASAKRWALLKLAKSQVGETEHPANSNWSKFSHWYGMQGPWCAMFVTWLGVACGIKSFKRGSRYAYVPALLADAQQSRNGLYVVHSPLPGDLILFDWDGDGVADHIGVVERWANFERRTVEGNTDLGDNSNGGKVQERADRFPSEAIAFVRYKVS
jgi:peptidoglycan hydrolase-like protein with peptidoglycan-binding domain